MEDENIKELELTEDERQTLERYRPFLLYRKKKLADKVKYVAYEPHPHAQLAKAMWDYIVIIRERVPNEQEWALISKVLAHYDRTFRDFI